MIRVIRNLGMHLWLATLVSIPITFLVLPGLKRVFVEINPLVYAGLVLLICFLIIGFLIQAIAEKMIARLLQEGETWDRAGLKPKAQKAYIRAIRIFDTFVFWPFSNRRVTRRICGGIAKFNAAKAPVNINFDLASTVYLNLQPDDEDIALIWLERMRWENQLSQAQQSLLTLIVEHHYKKKQFTRLLADIFINLERKDFAAQKIFRHLINYPDFQEKYKGQLEGFIVQPGSTLGKDLPPSEPAAQPSIRIKEKINFRIFFIRVIRGIRQGLHKGAAALGKWLQYAAGIAFDVVVFFKQNRTARACLKFGFLIVVFGWLCFFMVNTISHLFKSKAVEPSPVKEVIVAAPKPFTIQVAAYLKQEHADRYVKSLKQKGVDARVKKVDGGGKRWYLVRVSEFTDKNSAFEYGNKLKNQGIIEDFFVNNNK